MIDYNDLTKNIKDGLKFPTGATSERGTPSKGSLRFNSETGKPEIYAKSRGWKTAAQESSGSYSYLTTDLLVDLDAGNPNSYSGSGSTWTDLQGNLNMQKDPNNYSSNTNTGYNSNGWFEMGPDRYPNWMDYPHSWESTGDMVSLLSGTNFSMDIWVKLYSVYDPNVNPTYDTFVGSGAYDRGIVNISKYESQNGKDINAIYKDGTGSYRSGANSSSNDWSDWIHLVYTYESANKHIVKLYLNGTLESTGNSYYGGNHPTSGKLRLGSNYSASYAQADIDLASFRLYDKTLSATEVADNFNNTKSRFGL